MLQLTFFLIIKFIIFYIITLFINLYILELCIANITGPV